MGLLEDCHPTIVILPRVKETAIGTALWSYEGLERIQHFLIKTLRKECISERAHLFAIIVS